MRPVGIANTGNRVAQRLDCAESIVIAEKDQEGTVRLREVALSAVHPMRRVQEIVDLGVETLICGALSGFVARMFEHHGILVFDWVVGETREILTELLAEEDLINKVPPGDRKCLHSANRKKNQRRTRKRSGPACQRKGTPNGKE